MGARSPQIRRVTELRRSPPARRPAPPSAGRTSRQYVRGVVRAVSQAIPAIVRHDGAHGAAPARHEAAVPRLRHGAQGLHSALRGARQSGLAFELGWSVAACC